VNKMTSSLKVLIADDHVLIRDGLKHRLQQFDHRIEICEGKDGNEVLEIIQQYNDINIILLDLYMPDTDGFQLLITLCDSYPDIPIIVLSSTEERSIMRKVLDIGAAGFIPKSTSHEVTMSAIQLVLSGGVYIPPSMLTDSSQQNELRISESRITQTTNADFDIKNHKISNDLTGRQKDVFYLLIKGLQNKEIARSLGLSEHTVKIHVTAILKVLNVTNRIQAVLAVHNMTNK